MSEKLIELRNPLVFDSSSIFNFGHRGNLESILIDLRKKFDLIITNEVFEEITKNENKRDFYKEFIRKYFLVKKIKLKSEFNSLIYSFSEKLGKGEQSVILFTLYNQGTAIIDDKLARKFALQYNVRVIGTLGILKHYFKKNKIDEACFRNIIINLRNNGFRIPELNNQTSIEEYLFDLEK